MGCPVHHEPLDLFRQLERLQRRDDQRPGRYLLLLRPEPGQRDDTLNATSWPVKIYIDSSYDTSGPCSSSTSGDGSLTGSNGFAITNTSGTASNVQIYFYGQPGCTTSCPNEFSPNSQTLNADVFAPYSSSTPGGSFTMNGEMVIGQLTANNVLTFTYQAASGGGSGSSNTSYYPTADATCVPSTTTGGTTGTC